MRSITRAVSAAMVAASIAFPAVADAAPKSPQYPTYHINELFLTPYQTKVTMSLGDYNTADTGKTYLAILFHAVNKEWVSHCTSMG